MRDIGGVERTNQGNVIDVPGEMGECVRDPHPRLTVLGKLERAPHQCAGVLDRLDFTGNLIEIGLAMMFVEFRLGIKQIHLTGATIHKQMNHRLGLCGAERPARNQAGDIPRWVRWQLVPSYFVPPQFITE